jgi:hypothetical protein
MEELYVAPETPVAQTQPVFSSSLSRRDMRNLRDRSENTPDISALPAEEVVFDVAPIFESNEVENKAEDNRGVDYPAEINRSEDRTSPDNLPTSAEAPQTIAAATAATAATAIAGSIASRRRAYEHTDVVIDHREDSSEITEDYEPFSFSTMSTQSTGIIPTTGSALILPTLPEHAPGALSSFNHTGEIYLTGSISLPSSMGSYGADMLSLDTSEIDIISDDEDVSSSQDLAPVRASSAVSAYSTSNTVVTVPSKFRDRLPLVLAITAAGLAVGVVALFITGYVLGVF